MKLFCGKSSLLKAVSYFYKKLHHRCLTEFQKHLCSALAFYGKSLVANIFIHQPLDYLVSFINHKDVFINKATHCKMFDAPRISGSFFIYHCFMYVMIIIC